MEAHAKWIWLLQEESIDQYAEFYNAFDYNGESVRLQISADSNYAVYLNGQLAYSGQYPDFPYDKVYDELNLTPHCRKGRNHLAIVVWYYGKSNMSYYPGRAALRYALAIDGRLQCYSDETTLSRQSLCYQNGRAKDITSQLGFGFRYDLTREDNWMLGELNGFAPSRIVPQNLPLRCRPIPQPVIHAPAISKQMVQNGAVRYLFDLGREDVGLLTIRCHSSQEQDVLIAYGEHIADGGVRQKVGGRDFSAELRLRKGANEYINPFRRLGLRYLELFAAAPVEVEVLTILPVEYPLTFPQNRPPMNALQQRIYDTCLRTLHLCMHEHYEDTPWREQALYAMDSRNQMLCGYCAFKEYAFPRANLQLMSKDNRTDGLLSICIPSKDNLTIPSFSLHYFTAVYEYAVYSGDLTLIREIWPKLTDLINVFIRRMDNDLLPLFEEEWHWNFYEWSDGLSGGLFQRDDKSFDAALNCLFSRALQTMQKLCALIHAEGDYAVLAEKINAAIRRHFFDKDRGVFVNSEKDDRASLLVNSLVILCGAAEGECAQNLAAKLTDANDTFTPISLSMRCFLYDALLAVDRNRYAARILEDIDRRYSLMLDAGATTFWETEIGESDFDNAGSLCHGWSAMPVYYYHQLLGSPK